ncbi:helix-hairpin-helix domain-containing protein [Gottfriedia luciferensis]|uniref:helix-hairpin-helix domain-containing protein n=1 Tax=Gottfriedia luciferensis TaxID=178774 RepID=UPI000B43BD86|nr:helix-hairpin-helix domain-containing protein [Gottfriedia luciferensis]
MKKLLQNKLAWLALLIVILIVFNFYQTKRKNEVVLANPTETKLVEEKKETVTQPNSKDFMVDVKGAIKNPGVFHCKTGDRVFDAIRLAGGFHKEADINKVNLAEKLSDEMVIYVPRVGEEISNISLNPNHTNSNKDDAIDINHATQEELEKIPGIGPSKAKNILDYIEKNGPFTSVDQLESVNGIGKKSVEHMTPYIIIR